MAFSMHIRNAYNVNNKIRKVKVDNIVITILSIRKGGGWKANPIRALVSLRTFQLLPRYQTTISHYRYVTR